MTSHSHGHHHNPYPKRKNSHLPLLEHRSPTSSNSDNNEDDDGIFYGQESQDTFCSFRTGSEVNESVCDSILGSSRGGRHPYQDRPLPTPPTPARNESRNAHETGVKAPAVRPRPPQNGTRYGNVANDPPTPAVPARTYANNPPRVPNRTCWNENPRRQLPSRPRDPGPRDPRPHDPRPHDARPPDTRSFNNDVTAPSVAARTTSIDQPSVPDQTYLNGSPPQVAPRTYPSPRRTAARRQRLWMTALSSLAFAMAVTAFTLTLWSADFTALEPKTFCVPISGMTTPLDNATDLGYKVLTKMVNGLEMYCVNSSDALTILLTKAKSNEKRNIAASQNMTAVHVRLYDKDVTSQKTGYTLSVDKGAKESRTRNAIAGDRSVTINTMGWYFVYSSIYFKDQKDCNRYARKTWLHTVVRKRFDPAKDKKTYTILMRSDHTCCENCKQYQTSGFAGGVFFLMKDDRILVNMSAPHGVVDSAKGTNLGLFLVDENAQGAL